MEKSGVRIPSAVLELLHDESGESWEDLARAIDTTQASMYRWRRKGLSLDALIVLLKFATDRQLERSENKLAHHLKDACGPNVQIVLVPRRQRRAHDRRN